MDHNNGVTIQEVIINKIRSTLLGGARGN